MKKNTKKKSKKKNLTLVSLRVKLIRERKKQIHKVCQLKKKKRR